MADADSEALNGDPPTWAKTLEARLNAAGAGR
jgi:hypothetical protein